MSTMQDIGKEQGCGRALWEHQTGNDVSSYGTPMALMLLPFLTDGCIGSMEGLYFEASGTTPYHFLTAAAGSKQASNPVRRLAYDNDNVAAGRPLHAGPRRPLLHGVPARRRRPGRRQPGPHAAAPGRPVDDLPGGRQRPGRAAHDRTRRREGGEAERAAAAPGEMRDRWLELGTSWFQHPDDWAAVPADSGPSDWQRITVKPDGQKTDDRHLAARQAGRDHQGRRRSTPCRCRTSRPRTTRSRSRSTRSACRCW